MLRKTLPLAIIMVLFFATAAWCAPIPVEFLYNGNVDPELNNSAGPGLRFVNQKAVDGTVVYDEDANDKLAFEIVDDFDDGCVSGSRADYVLTPNAGISFATIVGRIKTLSDTHVDSPCPPEEGGPRTNVAGGNLGILMPVTTSPFKWGNSACMHWGGDDGLGNGDIEDIWRDQGTTVAGDADYHIFRMTIKGTLFTAGDATWNEDFEARTLDTMLDGQGYWTGGAPGGMEINPTPPPTNRPVGGLTVVDDPITLPVDHGQVCALVFGVAAYTETIPLIVEADPVTHLITIECDMLGTTAAGPVGWYINILDVNGNYICSWNGGANYCRGRQFPGGANTSNALLTLTAWDHLKLVIDTVNGLAHYYVNTVELTGSPLAVKPGSSNIMGSIQLASTYNQYARDVIYLDNLGLTSAATRTPTELLGYRTVKVYKDEDLGGVNLTPVLETVNAAPVDSNDNLGGNVEGFLFGTDDTLARQTIRFDWVSGSNQGAFAPGAEVAVLGHSLIPAASYADTILEVKQATVPTTVIINDATVSCEILDAANTQIGFGIQTADRTDGIRVEHLFTVDDTPVMPGSVVNVVGVTNTDRGELHIDAPFITWVSDPEEATFPPALCMNNKASGGGALFNQPAVWTYRGRPFDLEDFSYPGGALPGNGSWTGTMLANRLKVEGGALKFMRNNGPQDAITKVTWDASATSYKVSFNVKKSVNTGGATNNFWRVILKSNDNNHREIGRWEGYWAKVVPERVDTTTTTGPDVTLTTDYQKLTIEVTPSKVPTELDGNHSNVVNFLVNDGLVWTHTYYSAPASSPRYPYSITLQNQNRGTTDLQHVILDDFALENMTFPFPLDIANKGLNNVGLFVRLYGTVTAVKSDGANDDENYFYIDDGSGLLDLTAMGVRCKPPSMGIAVLPTEGDYVAVEGVMGVRDGARYLWTWDWQLQ